MEALLPSASTMAPNDMSGISAGQKSVRDILLDVAVELLQRNAGNAITIDDVCHVAKIRRSSFYDYFSSLNDLLLMGYKKAGYLHYAAPSGIVNDQPAYEMQLPL